MKNTNIKEEEKSHFVTPSCMGKKFGMDLERTRERHEQKRRLVEDNITKREQTILCKEKAR